MGKELQKFQASLTAGSLSSYIHWVNQIPLLTEEEEQELAHRLQQSGDIEAARRMVLAHLRLVVKMARGYRGYGLSEADLIQEGNIGLMKAVKRFDPNKGVRLVSFAVHWIRAEMHEFIIRNWRIVKIATTKAQRKLFFNIRRAAKKLSWFSDDEVKTVAEELNVSEKEVRLMEARMSSVDQSFDMVGADNDDHYNYSVPANYLEDASSDPAHAVSEDDWSSNQLNHLADAMAMLDERSQDILRSRWLAEKKATLHALAAKYDVSAERIRQLEQQAMQKVKQKMLEAAA